MAASQRDIAEADDSGRKIIIVVAIIAAVVIAGLFYVLMKASSGGSTTGATLQGAIRPGSADWDKYAQYVVCDEPEADEAKRALGDIWMGLRTTVRNFTGKTLNGLEVRASVVNQQGKAIKESTVVVIPSDENSELAPNKTVSVAVGLDGMKDGDDRANIKMEITAFRFKP